MITGRIGSGSTATAWRRSEVERPWGRMRVWRAGRGPVVLAVHGLGGSGRYWRGLADRICDDHTLIAPDLPGFGASRAPGLDVDVDRFGLIEDLDAVVEATATGEPLHVVGHSLGAVLGALWAARHLDRVLSLALASPPFPDGSAMDLRSRADLRPSAGRRLAATITRAAWPVMAVPIALARGYPRAVVVDFGRQSVRARAHTMWALWSDPELARELGSMSALDGAVPTLLAQARDDRTVSIRAHERWTRVLPHAERHVLETGGHQFLLRTRFEPLTGWLRRTTPPS